jgi:hypothetical protein
MLHYFVTALRENPELAIFLTPTNIEGSAHGATSRESFP